MVTICTASLTFNNSTFCPHILYLCVLCGSENKQRLFPYTALTDCITEIESVYCAVRTECLYIINIKSNLQYIEDRILVWYKLHEIRMWKSVKNPKASVTCRCARLYHCPTDESLYSCCMLSSAHLAFLPTWLRHSVNLWTHFSPSRHVTVSWQWGWVSRPRDVSTVGYAVTLTF